MANSWLICVFFPSLYLLLTVDDNEYISCEADLIHIIFCWFPESTRSKRAPLRLQFYTLSLTNQEYDSIFPKNEMYLWTFFFVWLIERAVCLGMLSSCMTHFYFRFSSQAYVLSLSCRICWFDLQFFISICCNMLYLKHHWLRLGSHAGKWFSSLQTQLWLGINLENVYIINFQTSLLVFLWLCLSC